MAASAAIVTAWDPPDGQLLSGLLGSIAEIGVGGRAVRVLVPDEATARVARLLRPALALETVVVGGGADEFPGRLAETLPLLPQIVHGFDRYLWIAPALWLAAADAIEPYDLGVDRGALAGAYEIDRGYRIYASTRSPLRSYRAGYLRLFGEQAATRMYCRPMVNTGMIALGADAPHWAAWRDAYGGLDRDARAWSDGHLNPSQLALNFAIVRDRLPVAALPAPWNWLCHWERPLWDGARLVEPQPPHAAIRVVHLSGQARERDMTIDGRDGAHYRSRLRFPLAVAPAAAAA
ncbi:MAG: hypothetical protein AB7O45_09095 [Alphaproteobacteria bacterium]